MRGLKSIAVFYVNRDAEVFWLDLGVLGLKKTRSSERYAIYFKKIIEWLVEYGLNPERYVVSEHVLRYQLQGDPPRNALVLAVTLSHKGRVIYAVLASFTPGVLIILSSRFRNAGWKSEFLLDMAAERIQGYSSTEE
ncbi:MAG: hypothetical protein ACP5II_03985 [Infirmifilum sp.]|jgi:hypothetical protein